ncbi:MAG: PQQ-binding-like beta-propeller repeat protein, partial [Pseudomonadota bacterium]
VGWAINAETGRVEWQLNGSPSGSGYVGGAGPAVNTTLALFPFPSGELRAVFRRGGLPRWGATVLGGRPGVAYSVVSDVAADPVIADGRVYVANPAGRLAVLNLNTGARIWTAADGALTAPVVAGRSVFLVSDQNVLTRLDAETGARVWTRALPLFEEDRPRRQQTVFAHHGPVLAGGLLWLASSDAMLRAFDPVSGTQVRATALPEGAVAAPVVAGETMYVVTKAGELLAFR